jgi:hypothetical protein
MDKFVVQYIITEEVIEQIAEIYDNFEPKIFVDDDKTKAKLYVNKYISDTNIRLLNDTQKTEYLQTLKELKYKIYDHNFLFKDRPFVGNYKCKCKICNPYYRANYECNKEYLKEKYIKDSIEFKFESKEHLIKTLKKYFLNNVILFHFDVNYFEFRLQQIEEKIGMYDSTYWDAYFSFKENKKNL